MLSLTPLELASIKAIIAETDDVSEADQEKLLRAFVLSRENTGGGFFTKLAGPATAIGADRHLGENVWISVSGLEHGLGMILHLEAGRPALLEGYAVGPEDTSKIDFEHARFAVASRPGPLRGNGS